MSLRNNRGLGKKVAMGTHLLTMGVMAKDCGAMKAMVGIRCKGNGSKSNKLFHR